MQPFRFKLTTPLGPSFAFAVPMLQVAPRRSNSQMIGRNCGRSPEPEPRSRSRQRRNQKSRSRIREPWERSRTPRREKPRWSFNARRQDPPAPRRHPPPRRAPSVPQRPVSAIREAARSLSPQKRVCKRVCNPDSLIAKQPYEKSDKRRRPEERTSPRAHHDNPQSGSLRKSVGPAPCATKSEPIRSRSCGYRGGHVASSSRNEQARIPSSAPTLKAPIVYRKQPAPSRCQLRTPTWSDESSQSEPEPQRRSPTPDRKRAKRQGQSRSPTFSVPRSISEEYDYDVGRWPSPASARTQNSDDVCTLVERCGVDNRNFSEDESQDGAASAASPRQDSASRDGAASAASPRQDSADDDPGSEPQRSRSPTPRVIRRQVIGHRSTPADAGAHGFLGTWPVKLNFNFKMNLLVVNKFAVPSSENSEHNLLNMLHASPAEIIIVVFEDTETPLVVEMLDLCNKFWQPSWKHPKKPYQVSAGCYVIINRILH